MTPEEAAYLIKNRHESVHKYRFDLFSEMTLNKVSRCHHQITAKIKKNGTNNAELSCFGRYQFKGKIWVEIFYFVKRNIDPLDNLPASLKPILDGMVNAGIIEDDSMEIIQDPVISWFVKFEKKRNQSINNFVVLLLSKHPIYKGQPLIEVEEEYATSKDNNRHQK